MVWLVVPFRQILHNSSETDGVLVSKPKHNQKKVNQMNF